MTSTTGPTALRRTAPLVAVLFLSVALAGCASLDDLNPARIPARSLEPGWSLNDDKTDSGEVKAGPLTVAVWRSLIWEHNDPPRGLIAIVTVSDVALADEEGRIRDEFANRLEEEGVTRTERRSGEMSVDGETADYTLYDAEIETDRARTTAEGFVLEYTYKCGAEDTVVGFLAIARTEVHSAIGSSTDMSTWREVAGPDWEQSFGGMSTAVECSA